MHLSICAVVHLSICAFAIGFDYCFVLCVVLVGMWCRYPSFGYEATNTLEPATYNLWELTDAPFEGTGMNSRNHRK